MIFIIFVLEHAFHFEASRALQAFIQRDMPLLPRSFFSFHSLAVLPPRQVLRLFIKAIGFLKMIFLVAVRAKREARDIAHFYFTFIGHYISSSYRSS